MRSILLFTLLTLTAAAQTAAPPPSPASLQNLVGNSPFGSAAQVAGAPAAATPLEFRGTFVDGGERFFSVLDPSTRRAEWVALNESGRPFTVKSFDPEKEAITVEFQGRSLDLKLHSARIGVAAVAPAPTPPVATNGQPAPANVQARPAVPTASEAQRLAQVAEEIRRRRALRQQAQGQPPPNTAPPPQAQPRN